MNGISTPPGNNFFASSPTSLPALSLSFEDSSGGLVGSIPFMLSHKDL
jgi:hypothetical protein